MDSGPSPAWLAAISFRPLERRDLGCLHTWINTPHVRRFWGGSSLAEISCEYAAVLDGIEPVHPYIVSVNGTEVGFIQWLRIGDFPDFQRALQIEDPNTATVDMLLGEPAVVGKGVGVDVVRAFLAEVVFAAGFESCAIDPEPDNVIAIRAYEKAGFRFIRAVPDNADGHPAYVMEIRREKLGQSGASDAYFLRPALPTEMGTACSIDDDACSAFGDFDPNLRLDLANDHPFVLAEAARWRRAATRGRMLFACAHDRTPVGLLVYDTVHGAPIIEQVSVRRSWARQGVGRALVERAIAWSVREGELWLTTYANVPWNAPWYASLGFERVDDEACAEWLRELLRSERAALPRSDERIAMVYRHR